MIVFREATTQTKNAMVTRLSEFVARFVHKDVRVEEIDSFLFFIRYVLVLREGNEDTLIYWLRTNHPFLNSVRACAVLVFL